MSTYPIPMSPPVNAGLLYVNGLRLSFVSTTAISISAGQARDARNINDISSPVDPNPPFNSFDQFDLSHGAINSSLLSVPQAITISTATSGAGGLDTGTIGNYGVYAVYVIGSSAGGDQASANGVVETSAILSLNASEPLLPAGYDMFRRIGYVCTDGSAHIREFAQTGEGSNRWMLYGAAVATDITAGHAVVGAPGAINFISGNYASVPLNSVMVRMLAVLTPNSAGNSVSLHPHGAADGSIYAAMSGDVAAVAHTDEMDCPCSLTGHMDYFVSNASDAIALSVQGYQDQL